MCVSSDFSFRSNSEAFAGGKKKKEVKKETGLGLTNHKAENFGEWYSEVFCFRFFDLL